MSSKWQHLIWFWTIATITNRKTTHALCQTFIPSTVLRTGTSYVISAQLPIGANCVSPSNIITKMNRNVKYLASLLKCQTTFCLRSTECFTEVKMAFGSLTVHSSGSKYPKFGKNQGFLIGLFYADFFWIPFSFMFWNELFAVRMYRYATSTQSTPNLY